jgi:hypothetical protein
MEAVRGDTPIPLIDYPMKYDLWKQSDRCKIPYHIVFDCKFDGRRKGRLVAGVNHTVVTSEQVYSGVVGIETRLIYLLP